MADRPGGFLYADDDVLAGVLLALKGIDKEAKKEWAAAMRTSGTRVWKSAIRNRTSIPQDDIFGTASIAWSLGGKGTAKVAPAASKRQQLSGGLGTGRFKPAASEMRFVDFGTGDARLPARTARGRVVYSALTPFGSWMGQMALKTVADLVREAVNVDG